MLIDIIYNIPSWLLGVIIVTLITTIAVIGLHIVRRFVNNESKILNNELVIGLGHQAGVIFAIVVGFVAVAVLQSYDKAGTTVDNEATDAFDIWIDSRVYPAEHEALIRNGVENYLNIVVHEEWPLQAKGKPCINADRALESLYRILVDYAPKSESQKIVHTEVLRKINALFEARRARLFINSHGLDSAVYYETILSLLVILGFAWSFGTKNPKGHTVLTAMLGFGIGLVLFLVVTFDWPYRGDVCISSKPFQTVLDHMERLKIEQPVSSGT